MLRHFVLSRWLHPLAPLKRLSPVDLPSANGFDKPFAASKFGTLMIMEEIALYRLLSMGIEVFSAAIILLPALFLLNRLLYHDIKKTIGYIVFSLYLTAVYAVVGLPSVMNLQIDLCFNFIPFFDMVADFKNAVLNVVLFIPLGIILPLLWEDFRSIKKSLLMGLGMTLTIEVLQIFTFRTTDINDLITNVTGTLIGYYIANMIIRKNPKISFTNGRKSEVFQLFAITFGIMFFVQPFISSMLWEFIL